MSVTLLAIGLAAGAPARAAFTLDERLGHSWTRELVTFAAAPQDHGRMRLLGPDGAEVPFQTTDDGRVAFLVDLPAGARHVYRLVDGPPAEPPPDLVVEERSDALRLWTSRAGVAIPTAQGQPGAGPVAALRLPSGRWIGASRLGGAPPIAAYEARLTGRGPVFAEAEVRYRFAGGGAWTLRFRVIAGEPVVRVSERFESEAAGGAWELLLSPGLDPTHVFFRASTDRDDGKGRMNEHAVFPLRRDDPAPITLAPWLPWWQPAHASFFGIFHTEGGWRRDAAARAMRAERAPEGAMLVLAAGRAATWAAPGDDGSAKAVPLVVTAAGECLLRLPLAGPGREWLLATSDAREALTSDIEVSEPQRLLVKHLETPLDDVKDLTLGWPEAASWPRLVVTAGDVPRLRQQPPDLFDRDPGRLALRRYLLTLDPAAALEARALLDRASDLAVRHFLAGSSDQPSASAYTHHTTQRVGNFAASADLLLGTPLLNAEERATVLARLAFLAEKLASPDFQSPERGYAANPNMTTSRYVTLGLLGCLLPGHPRSPEWVRAGLGEAERELREWAGATGAWLEAPHYQTVALADILLLAVAAYNGGHADIRRDPRLARTLSFLARLSTPPDPRLGGRRHLAPIGNTYLMETTALLAVGAGLLREDDPARAAELWWAWIAQGRPRWAGIGGEYLIHHYLDFLIPGFEPAAAPAWTSEHFEGGGAVLRHGFPGPRETWLFLIDGPLHAHYDDDVGSFELWGKGEPLALDWGYGDALEAWKHNRVDLGAGGRIDEFSATPAADHVRARHDGWERQLLFVKDADPLGPSYVLLRDAVDRPAHAWLWLATDTAPARDGERIRATGRGEVDLDVWTAAPRRLETLEHRASSHIGDGRGAWRWTETHQHGLRIPLAPGEPLLWLLYPRLRTETDASFTVIEGSSAVRVVSPAGVDVAFLEGAPFEQRAGEVVFHGRVGLVQIRRDRIVLTLPQGGELACGEHRLRATGPASRTFVRTDDVPSLSAFRCSSEARP